MKYIVCYSGGHSSALVAIEAVRKYGKENVILLNHDISSEVEHQDIKRFKADVADYLDMPITPANMPDFETMTPLRVCRKAQAFQTQPGQAFCTSRLKTEPFHKYLAENYPVPTDMMAGTLYEAAHPSEMENEEVVILYGFDKNEPHRIQRKSGVLGAQGYRSDYPLAFWNRTLESTEELGITRPITYKIFKHANCFACLKAGMQHWYIVYCLRPELFAEAIETELDIGHSIINGVYMEELIPRYKEMQSKGICPNDRENSAAFWAKVNSTLPEQQSFLPCDCAVL